MYYYAYINENNIVTQIVSLPSAITAANYIAIDSADQTLVGKYYNAATGAFEEVTAFYYAQLNEKGIVTGVFEMAEEIEDGNLIRVPSLDQTLVGKYFDRENGIFIDPPVSVLAELSSEEINHGEEWLADVLDAKAAKTEVYNKTQADERFAVKGEEGGSGASAYELALENGFEGTQEEWLASLKGDTGEQGLQGIQGLPGEKGEKGDMGAAGTRGATGAQGAQGIQGEKGDPGEDFGGELEGQLLRLNGQQAIYDSGTMMTFGTNNRETMIAGSKIYSKVAIQTSSDRRLKEAIKTADTKALADMINGIEIVRYKYIGNDTEHVGVIAQDLLKTGKEAALFVGKDDEGFYTVSMTELVFPLVAAVQALSDRVKKLEAK